MTNHDGCLPIFANLFGSDSEEEQEESTCVPQECHPCCHGVDQVPGLYIWKGWLTEEEQRRLLFRKLCSCGTCTAHKLPGMHLPPFRYNPGDGIRPHVDLMRFEDGIAVISLGDSAVMQFSQPEQNPGHTVQVGIIKVAQRLA
eukprot:1139784-Pelagomonas_calceolata.AAC.2